MFNVEPEQEIVFDDIYINVDSNSDVYKASYGSGNKGKEEYTLNISTSHNGFYVSNFMTGFANSGVEKFLTDQRFTGTLTALNSHAILRNRYKPSTLFDGSLYGSGWAYGEIYQIETLTDKNFLPLQASWNTEEIVFTLFINTGADTENPNRVAGVCL